MVLLARRLSRYILTDFGIATNKYLIYVESKNKLLYTHCLFEVLGFPLACLILISFQSHLDKSKRNQCLAQKTMHFSDHKLGSFRPVFHKSVPKLIFHLLLSRDNNFQSLIERREAFLQQSKKPLLHLRITHTFTDLIIVC